MEQLNLSYRAQQKVRSFVNAVEALLTGMRNGELRLADKVLINSNIV